MNKDNKSYRHAALKKLGLTIKRNPKKQATNKL